MPQARNLAEALGIADPRAPETQQPPEPVPAPEMSGRDVARLVLNSTQYRDSLLRRILLDELPPMIEAKLMDYAWGKPVERIEIETTNPFNGLSIPELEEQVALLHRRAQRLCTEPDAAVFDDDDTDPTAIH